MAAQPQEAKPLTPPYVAFATFKNMIGGFKEHVLPSRIDRSVLGNFSGIVGGQLLTTLRFLQLTDGENRPQQILKDLVDTINSGEWPNELGAILRAAYAPVFKLDLEKASPSEFSEHFATVYPGEGSTLRKSMTFFLTAVQEAKLPISPYILKNKKPRSTPVKKRAKQNGVNKTPLATPVVRQDHTPLQHQTERKLSEQVLAILDSSELPKPVEDAVYVLLRHLRQEGK
jgi:hypothetical protein